MPVVMQVNFMPGDFHARETEADKCAVAEMINALPGFAWKIWITDPATKMRGGIYLFEDLAAARGFGDGILAEKLAEGGARDVSIRYFEVEAGPSAINRAPLAVAALHAA